MLRLVSRNVNVLASADGSFENAVVPLVAVLFAEGRLSRAEATTLLRSVPALRRCDDAYDRILALNPDNAEKNIAYVTRVQNALAVPAWVSEHMRTLNYHAMLFLPDLGSRYQYLCAILVTLLVTS